MNKKKHPDDFNSDEIGFLQSNTMTNKKIRAAGEFNGDPE